MTRQTHNTRAFLQTSSASDAFSDISNVYCVKCFITPIKFMKFADYIRSIRNEKKLSLKDVEHRSGGEVSSGYINQIENGEVSEQSISVRKLKALAKGLQHNEERIFRVARGLSPDVENDESFEFELFGEKATDIELIAVQAYFKGLKEAAKRNDKEIPYSNFKRRNKKTNG